MESAARVYKDLLLEAEQPSSGPRFAKAMLDASVDCIKVIAPDGTLLTMNKAGCLALGVSLDSNFGMPWLPLLPVEVHKGGQLALDEARKGHHARFPGRSESSIGTIYWDNLLTPILDSSGNLQSILCVSRDVTAKTILEGRLAEAINREQLLAREMQHRIKNIYSSISGLIRLSEREANEAGSDANPMEVLRGKLSALSRASDAIFEEAASGDAQSALGALVWHVMRPYEGRFEVQRAAGKRRTRSSIPESKNCAISPSAPSIRWRWRGTPIQASLE
ncbi:MAG: PAS domain-containing protein [Mesorhizobium sp.]